MIAVSQQANEPTPAILIKYKANKLSVFATSTSHPIGSVVTRLTPDHNTIKRTARENWRTRRSFSSLQREKTPLRKDRELRSKGDNRRMRLTTLVVRLCAKVAIQTDTTRIKKWREKISGVIPRRALVKTILAVAATAAMSRENIMPTPERMKLGRSCEAARA
jgi:hypothetical protein